MLPLSRSVTRQSGYVAKSLLMFVAQMACKPTAAAAVLALPELLEKVLLNLNVPVLFKVQRVNKNFKSAIKNSPALQRKMFFLDNPFAEIGNSIEVTVNPLRFHPKVGLRDHLIILREPAFDTTASFEVHILASQSKQAASTHARIRSHGSWRSTVLFGTPCSTHHEALVPISSRRLQQNVVDLQAGATLGQLADAVNNAKGFAPIRESLIEGTRRSRVLRRGEDYICAKTGS